MKYFDWKNLTNAAKYLIALAIIISIFLTFTLPVSFADYPTFEKRQTQVLCDFPFVQSHNDYKIYTFNYYTVYKDDFSSVVYKDEGAYYVDYVMPDHTQYYNGGRQKSGYL